MENSSSIRSSPPPWPDLPPELLTEIARCLKNSVIDILRIRAVCQSWRLSLSLPLTGNPENHPQFSPNFPIKIPPYPFFSETELALFSCKGKPSFYLTPTTTFFLHPINGVPFGNSCSLLTFDELNHGTLCLRQPLSGLYKHTWANKSSPLLLDLLRFHVSDVSEHFVVRHLCVRQNASENVGAREVLKPSPFDKQLFAKAVLLTNLSLAVVLFGGKLGVIGLKDTEWKMIHDGGAFHYNDIVKLSCENLVYGVDGNGGAYLIRFNPESESFDQLPFASPIVGCSRRRKRLVGDSSSDRLLLVENYTIKSKLTIFVHKLELRWQNFDGGLQKWERIMKLDDQILFLDYHFSLCASPRDFHGLAKNSHLSSPRNCIFFTRESFRQFYGSNTFDSDEEIFFKGAGTHLNIGMFCLEDDHAIGLLEPGYDTLLLPPITWFLPEPNSVATHTRMIGIIQPPPYIRNIVDKTAHFVAK